MKNKKLIALIASACMCVGMGTSLTGCKPKADFTVGVCQLVQHAALDAATQGFKDGLTDKLKEAGKTVSFDVQNAQGDVSTCSTIVTTFVSKGVDLIMANATPALQAAMNATSTIPVLGTSVTDYPSAGVTLDTNMKSGTNVSGTSDLAPLDQQANLVKSFMQAKDMTKLGILYCSAEANSVFQVNELTNEFAGSGITVTPYSFADSNELGTLLDGGITNEDMIFIPTDNTCAANTNIIAQKLSDKPIFSAEENICKGCGFATLSISYYDLGKVTGEMAAEILLGNATAGDMAIRYASATTKKYVASRCTALGIEVPADFVELSIED